MKTFLNGCVTILAILVGLVAFFFVWGLFDSDGDSVEVPEFSVGETFSSDIGVDLTVNSINLNTADDGTLYAAANITFVNTADDDKKVFPSSWYGQNSDGVVSSDSETIFEDQMKVTTLAPGGTYTATVYFKDALQGEYILKWDSPSLGSSDDAVWKTTF